MTLLPLAISTGDPGGVGPEISLRVALSTKRDDPVVLYGDAQWLAVRAQQLGAPAAALRRLRTQDGFELRPGEIGLVDVGATWDAEALAHRATAAGGRAQLRALDHAIAAARGGRVRGLVTAPMSKAAVHSAGVAFTGHTEHLARAVGLADDEVTMLFLGPRLRVGLVTTHVSIAAAPGEITEPRVVRSALHIAQALLREGPASPARAPVVGVTGLNPHAGEAGLFGDEELRVVEPALHRAAALPPFAGGSVVLRGPIPAETAFRLASDGALDAVVAMLHDQATIASKLLDWGRAVNVTWGLPFVRTSVDHGVAYDAAERGKVDAEGMDSALRMAQRLTRPS